MGRRRETIKESRKSSEFNKKKSRKCGVQRPNGEM